MAGPQQVSTNRFLKILRLQKSCSFKIQKIAYGLGIPLSPTFTLDSIVDLPIGKMMDIYNVLLANECTQLSRDEEEMHILLTPAWEIFLSFGPKVVDLTAYLSYCPIELKYEYFKKAVIRLSEIAPDVEEFKLKIKEFRNNRPRDNAIDSELLQALSSLGQLKFLQIDDLCYFDELDDLIELCSHLPKLEFISVNFQNGFAEIDFEEHQTAEKLKKSMPNLKVFLYNNSAYCEFRRLCMDHLPKLQIIEYQASEFCHKFNYCNSTARPEPEFEQLTSNLRHLLVDFDQEETVCEDIHLIHPLVTSLWMYYSEEYFSNEDKSNQWKALLKFPVLQSLEIKYFPTPILIIFLEKYGLNLKALSIFQNESTLTNHQILSYCPRLEKLLLMRTMSTDTEPIVSISTNLKQVVLYHWSVSDDPNKIPSILTAPNLQTLTLHIFRLGVSDIKCLQSLISQKIVLQKLETLVIEMGLGSIGSIPDVEHFKETLELCKCAAANLPKLTLMRVYMNVNRIEYCDVAKCLQVGKTVNEEMPKVEYFFRNLHNNNHPDPLSWFVDVELICILENYRDGNMH